jgi:hypothetical protein
VRRCSENASQRATKAKQSKAKQALKNTLVFCNLRSSAAAEEVSVEEKLIRNFFSLYLLVLSTPKI